MTGPNTSLAQQPNSLEEAASSFALVGMTVEFHTGPGKPTLTVLVDRSMAVVAIPLFQLAGRVTTQLSTDGMLRKPTAMALLVASIMIPEVVEIVYRENQSLNSLSTRVSTLHFDIYGNEIQTELFVFDFSRALFAKIRWDRFDARNFPSVALNFKYSNSGRMLMQLE